ncbi:MAG: hypothetical protein DYG89_14825 [Caldilinea sp. CFX5]|nr:hypothetical protein [Caldilinea sp. CFX5]
MVGNRPVAALLPMMKDLTSLAQFDHIIEEEERVTLTLNGQPIAILDTLAPLVLFGEDTIDLEALAMSTDPTFLALIDQSRQHHEAKGGISSADMRQRLGIG